MTFQYHSPFKLGKDTAPYRKLDCGGVRVETFGPHEFLRVEREALRLLAEQAMSDINVCCGPPISPSLPRSSTTRRPPATTNSWPSIF